MKNNTIDATLLSARVALENAQSDPNVSNALSVFGFGEDRIERGFSLLETATQAQQNQKKEYGEQYAASDELDAVMNTVNKNYMRYVKLARVVFKSDRGVWETLQITGRRLKTYSGWIKQAKVFYSNALNGTEIMEQLATINVGEQQLRAGLDEVIEVEELLSNQLREKGEAQAATAARDEAIEALMDFTSDFRVIARIALENDPQYLEILGIVEPS